jgi:hypothetical protein
MAIERAVVFGDQLCERQRGDDKAWACQNVSDREWLLKIRTLSWRESSVDNCETVLLRYE